MKMQKHRIHGCFWLLHVGTATRSVRQYRAQMVALAERRQAHFVELIDSGRWRHYFTRSEFDLELRRAELLRDQWARIAGVLLEFDEAAEEPSIDRGAAA